MFKSYLMIPLGLLMYLSIQVSAARHISDQDLWKHVVTIDRLSWQEREGLKKINKLADDKTLVRRIYLDITGKIPTYEEMVEFINDKDVNKREKLIDRLLDSPGYASNLANMWGDLLRIPYNEGGQAGNFHNDFKKYVERAVYENIPYDQFVYNLITARGHVIENGGVSFYHRDHITDPMDTVNATVKAFLGTRIGCAQCHNHRFDKWTQKQFYETSAHLWGVDTYNSHGVIPARLMRRHSGSLNKEGFKGAVTENMLYVLNPSSQMLRFNKNDRLKYPENYVYDNAKPYEVVKEKIVFDYGDSKVEGSDRREVFAKWLTSKNNPMFARVMANRLWKRIMGVAIMEPVDDWKDNIEVQNPNLFKSLGQIFVDVNYDFKAFLSVVFNTEAYQMAVSEKNEINSENYKIQGAKLKRMSGPQLRDSLLTLTHGNLDRYAKMGSIYFEFENRLKKLAKEFHDLAMPKLKAFAGTSAAREGKTDSDLMQLMLSYAKKVKELEAEYNMGPKGYIGGNGKMIAINRANKMMGEESAMMMQKENVGSGKQSKTIIRANLVTQPEFMNVFGSTDRSSPETGGSNEATMKQILKMINSPECHNALKKDSFLMRNLYKKEKIVDRVAYLYLSIYGRSPSKKEVVLASNYIGTSNKHESWSNYALALINSPEFYFIQ